MPLKPALHDLGISTFEETDLSTQNVYQPVMKSSMLPKSASVNFQITKKNDESVGYQSLKTNNITPPQRVKGSTGNRKNYNISPDLLKPFSKPNSLAPPPPSVSSAGSTVFSNTKKYPTSYSESEKGEFDDADHAEMSFRKLKAKHQNTPTLNVNPQTRQFLDDFEFETDEENTDTNETDEEEYINAKAAQSHPPSRSKKYLNKMDVELNDIQENFEKKFHIFPEVPQVKPSSYKMKNFQQEQQNQAPTIHAQNSTHHNPLLFQPKSMMSLRPTSSKGFLSSPDKLATTYEDQTYWPTPFDKLGSIREVRRKASRTTLPKYKSMSNLKINAISGGSGNSGMTTTRKLQNKQSFPSLKVGNNNHVFSNERDLHQFQDKNDNFRDDTFGEDFDDMVPQYLVSSSPKKSIRPQAINVLNNFDEVEQVGRGINGDYERDYPELSTPQLHKPVAKRRWKSKKHCLNSFRENSDVEEEDSSDTGTVYRTGMRKPSNIQLLKQEIDSNTPITKGKMIYNPETFKWEGNTDALSEFPENYKYKPANRRSSVVKNDGIKLRKSRSTLFSKSTGNKIEATSTGSGLQSRKVVGNMQFDSKNQRWVSLHGDSGEIDPFKNIEDHVLAQSSSYGNSRFPSSGTDSNLKRYVSTSSANGNARASSTGKMYSTSRPQFNPTFVISSMKLEVFYHEENKWLDKLGGWINQDLEHADSDTRFEYAYEIRNMVLSSTKK
ncbi:hypothetical protein ACO0RG_003561 [Hanseniaspora osmophila]|uniref:Mitotic check point protein BFA1 n=1 Tax=Hanseniaspora osmophila TaxID=56408 RepID=A0A1E5RFM8_9ASCO